MNTELLRLAGKQKNSHSLLSKGKAVRMFYRSPRMSSLNILTTWVMELKDNMEFDCLGDLLENNIQI